MKKLMFVFVKYVVSLCVFLNIKLLILVNIYWGKLVKFLVVYVLDELCLLYGDFEEYDVSGWKWWLLFVFFFCFVIFLVVFLFVWLFVFVFVFFYMMEDFNKSEWYFVKLK